MGFIMHSHIGLNMVKGAWAPDGVMVAHGHNSLNCIT